MRKSKREMQEQSQLFKEDIDSLEKELMFLRREVEILAKTLDTYMNRVAELESNKRSSYTNGIAAKLSEMSKNAISGYVPSIGDLSKRIGDINTK